MVSFRPSLKKIESFKINRYVFPSCSVLHRCASSGSTVPFCVIVVNPALSFSVTSFGRVSIVWSPTKPTWYVFLFSKTEMREGTINEKIAMAKTIDATKISPCFLA